MGLLILILTTVVGMSPPCVDYPLVHTLAPAQVASPLAWSADSKRLAFVSESTTKIWDISNWEIRALVNHTHFVNGLAWSRGGLIATATSDGSTVAVINGTTGALFALLVGHSSPVNTAAWSTDGLWLASGSASGEIKIWNASSPSGDNVNTFQLAAKSIRSLGWSEQGELAVGSTGMSIEIYNPMNGTRQRSKAIPSPTSSLKWSPGGKKIAAVLDDGTAVIWDLVADSAWPLPSSSDKLISIDWSPEDRFVVCGTLRGSLGIWDANNGAHYRDFTGHENGTQFVAWSYDGQLIASSGTRDAVVRLWDTSPAPSYLLFPGDTNVEAVEFSAHNNRQFATAEVNAIKLWSFDGEVLRTFQTVAPIKAISFASAASDLITSGSEGNNNQPAMIQLWDINTGQPVRNFTRSPIPGSSFRCVSWSPSGLLLAACLDQSLLILNSDLGVIATISNPDDNDFTISVDWSFDERFVAFGSYRGEVKIWDVQTSVIRSVGNGTLPVSCVKWSPDGRRLMAASNNNMIIWDSVSLTLLRQLTAPDCGWSLDGEYLICGSDSNKIVVQHSETGQVLRNIVAPGLTPTSFIVGSFDGRNLATWSKEGSQVTVWHLSWVVGISLTQSNGTTEFHLNGFGLYPHNSWLQLTIYSFPTQCFSIPLSDNLTATAVLPPGLYQVVVRDWYSKPMTLAAPVLVNCMPGYELANSTCKACEGNTFQAQYSLASCTGCDGVVNDDRTRCDSCTSNSFHPFNTSLCVCTTNFYPVVKNGSMSCRPCPPFARCENGTVRADDGYWQPGDNHTSMLPCNVEKACIGGRCAPGYRGALCGECEGGYGQSGFNRCVECYGGSGDILATIALLIVVILVCGALAVLSFYTDGENPNIASSIFKVGLGAAQINAMLLQLNVPIPSFLHPAMYFSDGLQGAPATTFTISCTFLSLESKPADVYWKQGLLILFLPVLLLTANCLALSMIACRRKCKSEDARTDELKRWFITGAAAIFFVIHPTLAVHTFRLFPCQPVDNQGLDFRMRSDLAVSCDSTAGLRWGLGFTLLVFYIFAPPFLAVSYVLRQKIEVRATTNKLLFLCNDFKISHPWWFAVVLSRKVICAAVIALTIGEAQVVLVLITLTTFGFAHAFVQPYRKKLTLVGRLETASLLLSIFLFCFAFLFIRDITSAGSFVAGIIAFILFVVFYMVVVVLLLQNAGPLLLQKCSEWCCSRPPAQNNNRNDNSQDIAFYDLLAAEAA